MKFKVALAFALIGAVVGIGPASANAQKQSSSVHQHGSSFHDRSPRIHVHESQPHH